MTQKDAKKLFAVLSDLQRGIDFLCQDRVHVCTESRGTTTLDMKHPSGKFIMEINKEYGSDLCLLFNAKKKLHDFICTH